MIFTCNFANWKKIPGNIAPISIARIPPKNWDGFEYPPLWPTSSMLKSYKDGTLTNESYKKFYDSLVLSNLKPYIVVQDLYNMLDKQYDGLVLLCYESSDKFCHRHLVREWLIESKYVVREFDLPHVPFYGKLGLRGK
jgi:hypothetical protein